MTITIPTWAFVAVALYLAVGVALLPYIYFKSHQALKHNTGWTWKTTLFSRHFNLFRFIASNLLMVAAWPLALKEL
jgi:hypothetical protein